MPMGAGGAAWLCSLKQGFICGICAAQGAGCTPSLGAFLPPPPPLGCSPRQALFNHPNTISCFHSSCTRDLLMLHPRSGEEHPFLAGEGARSLVLPPFPQQVPDDRSEEQGASLGRGTRQIQNGQKANRKECRGRCLHPVPAFPKWWQFWMGNTIVRTSPRPAWYKLVAPPCPMESHPAASGPLHRDFSFHAASVPSSGSPQAHHSCC